MKMAKMGKPVLLACLAELASRVKKVTLVEMVLKVSQDCLEDLAFLDEEVSMVYLEQKAREVKKGSGVFQENQVDKEIRVPLDSLDSRVMVVPLVLLEGQVCEAWLE